ncbi:hypothetical protein SEPCBS119000_000858 [Sporothrix epigloea]|uniref:Uncharacterized protein n=1 Tax=Sporothrix epigloea TaxID=1892477 RepID=A0ABP0D923_9PEZI
MTSAQCHPAPGAIVAGDKPTLSSPVRRRTSSRRSRLEPTNLQGHTRSLSFEPEVDASVASMSSAYRTTERVATVPKLDDAGPFSTESAQEAVLSGCIPTLQHSNSKRDGHHLLSRTGSSKRRKKAHDREREAEIKAISSVNTQNHNDVKAAADLAAWKGFKETTKTNPSNFALPLDTDPVSYIISPFAALTPKPTLRYADQSLPRRFSIGRFTTRQTSQKQRLAAPLPEAVLRASPRIDDLAKDMTASDLREVMERDARRRGRRQVYNEKAAVEYPAQQIRSQGSLKKQQRQTSIGGRQPEASSSNTPVSDEVPELHHKRETSPETQPSLPAVPVLRHQAEQRNDLQTPFKQTILVDGDHNEDDNDSTFSTPTSLRRDQQLHSSYDSASMSNLMTNATRDDTPLSWLKTNDTEPSLELQQSQSLALIDSEGSWFSGRTASRRYVSQKQQLLGRASPSQDLKTRQNSCHVWHDTENRSDAASESPTENAKELGTASDNTAEADGSSIVMDDEFLKRLTRSSASAGSRTEKYCDSTGDMLPSSDEELETGNGVGNDRWSLASKRRDLEPNIAQSRLGREESRLGRKDLMTTFHSKDRESGYNR